LASRLQTWLTHGKAPQVYVAKSVELDDGGQAGLRRYGQQCLVDCAGSLPESEHLERLAAVAELHVQGYSLDYAALFAGQSPARLSLPTYPFATTQYWVESEPGTALPAAKTTARATLHPLVHENTSDFWQQRYSSVFTGSEMQFADHRVQGRRLLPGVAYLEMVHAAMSRSSGLQGFASDPDRPQRQETATAMVMRNVVWLRPVVAAGDATPISITLRENEAGDIEFEIYSDDHAGVHPVGDEPSPHTHARGSAILAANIDDAMPGSYRRINLDRLRSERSRGIDVDDCYAIYSSVGIEYGPAHRSLASVDIGTDSLGPYVLAEVRLPECTLDTQRQYALHPSILDGALQAALALEFADEQAASRAPRGPVVPFALEEAVITQRSPERAFVHIRAVDSERATPGLRKMNIDICDSAGRICVQLRGISSRELRTDVRGGDSAAAPPADPQAADDAAGGVLLAPCWEAETPLLDADADASRLCLIGTPGTAAKRRALQEMHPTAHLLDVDADATIDAIAGQLAALPSLEHLVWIAPEITGDQTLSAAQSACILGCFRTIKALLGLGHGDRPFELTVVTTQASVIDTQQPVNAAHAGVHGLIGSLAKEYEHWKVRLLDLPADEPWPYERLLRMPVDGQGSVWAYRDSEWLQQQMLPCDVDRREYAYRDGGVYVIVGGAGGLGEVLSEHLVREHGAQVVWLGRRECDETIRQKIERLARIGGPAPRYVRADATQRADVERAYREIKARHGRVNGIVHSAIVLLDKSLANMDEERFCAGLAPKVEASIHLAEIFGDEPLDFALFFSSFQSFARARGQANYAAGCTFKDAFAHELARSWRCPVKVMNWGYWGSVGIVASVDTQQRMAQLGVDSIEPAEGIAALDCLLAGPFTQLAFMKPVRASGAPEVAPAQIVELPADAPAVDVSIFSRRRIVHGA
ncbi:SDR family NAD(P)-dependent oxidoreductase, partial [Tahibacter sp.]|uniref:SDR family oxidoreductase n=1 Tax=Tahibacter sp. TaxID=2056211 RepID=UPI0028C4D1D3